MTAPLLKIGNARFGIDNAFARMPFRFGVVTIDAVASLTMELEFTVDGKPTLGYASDLLAYKWFDKRPEKTPADNVTDLLWVAQEAANVAKALATATLFDLWMQLDTEVDRRAVAAGFNKLGASFGVSMIERALIDGLGRAQGLSFHEMVQQNVLALRPSDVFPELTNMEIGEAVAKVPMQSLYLRHTVGLVDPILTNDLDGTAIPNDGLPQTLDDYLRHDGVRYLKVKVSGDIDADLDRLSRIATCVSKLGEPVYMTLDGNEQFKSLDDFVILIEAIRARNDLADLFRSILYIEQPLGRDVALSDALDQTALKAVSKPLMIDEADGWIGAFRKAIDLGYHGVSHKNCKGVIRSLLNAMLVHHHNARNPETAYFQSAEDLTCLPVVSLQADLAVVATLGLSHIERNGHHYFRGLDHLPRSEALAAIDAHPALYERAGQRIQLAQMNGMLDVSSLQVPGMGFSTLPDIKQRITPSDWTFAMLKSPGNG